MLKCQFKFDLLCCPFSFVPRKRRFSSFFFFFTSYVPQTWISFYDSTSFFNNSVSCNRLGTIWSPKVMSYYASFHPVQGRCFVLVNGWMHEVTTSLGHASQLHTGVQSILHGFLQYLQINQPSLDHLLYFSSPHTHLCHAHILSPIHCSLFYTLYKCA